jgi:hypothetical protein
VVGLILVMLVGVLVPQMIQKKRTSQRVACVGNLKIVVLGELLWINDNPKGRLSWQVPTNEGGTLEYLDRGKLFPHFKALSNKLSTPVILTCPADNREAVKAFSILEDSNLSYFMNMDAPMGGRSGPPMPLDEISMSIVLGDRNVTNNPGPRAGIISVTASNYSSLGWNSRMNHGRNPYRISIGNVACVDGSVRTMTPIDLQKAFKYEVFNGYSSRLALP